MKLKTIDRVIRNKMNDWIDSVELKELRDDMRKNIIVTGGCIASMLLREDVNDFDIYIKSEKLCFELAAYYCGKTAEHCFPVSHMFDAAQLKKTSVLNDDDMRIYDSIDKQPGRVRCYIASNGIIRIDKPEKEGVYLPVCITENAITLSDKVQIVTRFIGEPDEIHANYDFIHATNYWTFETGLVTHKKALESLLTRELFYSGSKYPLCSIIRTRKFINRKWTVNAGQYLKMVMQLNDMDLKDIAVLREQLTGVDSAYFGALIAKLEREVNKKKKESPNEESLSFQTDYILELIDEIFTVDMETIIDEE